MKQKYTFFLKTNNSKIVLTDDSETLESIQEKLSRLLNSKKIMVFQTNSDLIFIDPSQISAVHISKIEETISKESHSNNNVKKIKPTEEISAVIYDDVDDVDYTDDEDDVLNDDLINQIDDSSTLFSDLSEENSLYQTTDKEDDSDEIFETEQILDEVVETEEI
jgi:hypothetical protein